MEPDRRDGVGGPRPRSDEHWWDLAGGRLRYRFSDGEVRELSAGEAFHLRAGHLAGVLEDAELIEFTAAEDYRRKEQRPSRPC
jgi:quercetin dioxygenase-like cupin family protein